MLDDHRTSQDINVHNILHARTEEAHERLHQHHAIKDAALGGSRIDRALRKKQNQDQPFGKHYWHWCRTNSKQRWSLVNYYLKDLPFEDFRISDLTAGALGAIQPLVEWLAPSDFPLSTASRGMS
ncbi:hypothetical protein [uncultured Roseovarius sp.]|uniref:hypothetical protein n=1 Tax=uncultured Roseovarius sp. TaxID=293344 RepID=UPI0026150706|nr:hypothetical protein [uncultured Roseovarius sp.]